MENLLQDGQVVLVKRHDKFGVPGEVS